MATLRGQASRAPADSSRGARTHPPGSEDAPEAGIPSSARQCPLCPCVQGRGVRWERRDPEGSALSLCRAMGTDLLGAKGSCSSIPPWAQVLVEGGKAALPAFLSQTHLPSGNVPLHCQQGTAEALAGDQPARTKLHLESSPAAERATGELPGGTSSRSAAELGPSAPPGSLPRAAGFLPAPPARTCRRSCWLPNPLSVPTGTAGPSRRRSPRSPEIPALRHSERRGKGSRSHLCLALDQGLQAPGAECPPLGKREGGEEGEKRCLCCSAGGPGLGGQSRDESDTHGTAAAQLLLQDFDGGQSRHPRSLCSFCLPVHREGTEKE